VLTADALLAGPRGRGLCWNLLWLGSRESRRPDAWTHVWRAVVVADDVPGGLDALATRVAAARPATLAADSDLVLEALRISVNEAAYWQEPNDADRALEPSAVRAVLPPVAAALAAAPAAAWWASPLDPARQRYAQFLRHHAFGEPLLSGADGRVAAWRSDIAGREEALRREPPEPLGTWSGHWWSTRQCRG
jgi:hypothetical protein